MSLFDSQLTEWPESEGLFCSSLLPTVVNLISQAEPVHSISVVLAGAEHFQAACKCYGNIFTEEGMH